MRCRRTWTPLRLAGALATLGAVLAAAAQAAPPGVGECPSVPLQCVQSSAKVSLDVVRRAFTWKWTGRGVAIRDVENPTMSTGYNVCIYDGSQTLVVATGVPAAGLCPGGFPCWRARSWGFQYRDRSGLTGGITKIDLKVGRRRDKLTVTGQGPYLPLPAQPPALPLTVQLVRADPPSCWSAVATRLR